MNYNSYLNPYTIKESCRDYINKLEKENQYYSELLEKINEFFYEEHSKGSAIDATKELLTYYSVIFGSLIRANAVDIVEANALIRMVGEELIIGNEVIEGKLSAERDERNNRNNASSCHEKAYKATDEEKAIYWRKQGSYYDGLATAAYLRKRFFEGKEREYDEININTGNLFVRAEEIRASVSELIQLLEGGGTEEACEKVKSPKLNLNFL